jgi:hypothetical protein
MAIVMSKAPGRGDLSHKTLARAGDRLKAQARLAAEQARRSLIALYREMGVTAFPEAVVFTDRLDDLAQSKPPERSDFQQPATKFVLSNTEPV